MTPQLHAAIDAVLAEDARCSVDVHGFIQYFDRVVLDGLRTAYHAESRLTLRR